MISKSSIPPDWIWEIRSLSCSVVGSTTNLEMVKALLVLGKASLSLGKALLVGLPGSWPDVLINFARYLAVQMIACYTFQHNVVYCSALGKNALTSSSSSSNPRNNNCHKGWVKLLRTFSISFGLPEDCTRSNNRTNTIPTSKSRMMHEE